ncbi:MAG: dihydrolipoyl dehydrogenase [Chlamydiae bacterium]|nr:dihydrolipoyl dehydrogenase [Chlamydiota bacterium]
MDFDVIVIGSGPAGYVAAIKASQLGMRVACVEKDPTLGGTCLNVGCIPSKALLKSSHLYHEMSVQAELHGIEVGSLSYSLEKMMQRKNSVINKFTKGIDYLFKKNKITTLSGRATFVDPHTIMVGEKKVSAKNFIIATGSVPASLPFLPIDEEHIVTSTGALRLKSVPKRLVVIGAGVIGLELGSVYGRLGSEVTVVEYFDRILPEFDETVSKVAEKVFKRQGFTFRLGARVTKAEKGKVYLDQEVIEADTILVAIGRKPYSEGLGLEKIGVTLDARGYISIDSAFRTTHPHIYAIGDVACPPMLAHKGSKEAEVVAELIAGHINTVNYLAVPNVVYTDPEIASVGLTEQKAKELAIPYKTSQFPFAANSRQGTVSHDPDGFVKVLMNTDTQKIIGMHIIGPSASDLIMEGVIAIENNLPMSAILHANHAHPTFSEAVHEAILGLTKEGFIHI